MTQYSPPPSSVWLSRSIPVTSLPVTNCETRPGLVSGRLRMGHVANLLHAPAGWAYGPGRMMGHAVRVTPDSRGHGRQDAATRCHRKPRPGMVGASLVGPDQYGAAWSVLRISSSMRQV